MKYKRLLAVILVIFGLAGMLAGCGAASKSEGPMEMAQDAMAENEAGGLNSESSQSAPLPENRKWIVTIRMSAETEDLDGLMASVTEKVQTLEGYVEHQDVYNGSSFSDYRYRSASLTLRIPAERVDAFTEAVEDAANVVSNSRQLEDVTLQYVDTESRMNALKTEEARLLELLEQAETMSDLLEVEGRLTEVRYELESVGSQLRTYDNLVNYATVYLEIEEVREYTPMEEPTLWQRISGGFTDNLRWLGDSLVDLMVWIIVYLPQLLILGGVVWLIVWLSRKKRRTKKKKNKDLPPMPPIAPADKND